MTYRRDVEDPVAWRYKDSRGHWRYVGSRPEKVYDKYLKPEPLYASPVAADIREPTKCPTCKGEKTVQVQCYPSFPHGGHSRQVCGDCRGTGSKS